MNNLLKIATPIALALVLTGCANTGGSKQALCVLGGAAVGGGAAGALADDDEAIAAGAGAAIGALVGAILCADRTPAPEPVAEVAPEPAPPPPPPSPPPEPPKIIHTFRGVNFDFDKATIKPESEPILDEGVAVLSKYPDVNVIVVGHTDSIGSEAYNQKLSERRAEAVRDFLVGHGVSASRLSTEGRGESEPVASNDTKEGRYQNRRVELRSAGYAGTAAPAGGACDPKHWQCVWHPVHTY